MSQLVGLMQRLLAPDGCPWDREQTLETLVPYLVEETYEVVDALAAGDVDDHREELGDLLLQIVFQSELRFAEGKFGIDDVARGIVAKLVRRHPHVFGDVVAKDADAVLANWAKLKAAEKAEKGKHGALARHPGQRAGAAARDARRREGGRGRLRLARRRRPAREDRRGAGASSTRRAAGGDRAAMQRELGDVLFAMTNLARKLGLDAEQALRGAIDRFSSRFRHVELALAAEGRAVSDASADEQERLWQAAKQRGEG